MKARKHGNGQLISDFKFRISDSLVTARHREDEGSPSSDEIATRLEEVNVNVPTCREEGEGSLSGE